MQVIANGKSVELDDGATVDDLLRALGLGRRWVVVERNGEPVERRDAASTVMGAGDRMLQRLDPIDKSLALHPGPIQQLVAQVFG